MFAHSLLVYQSFVADAIINPLQIYPNSPLLPSIYIYSLLPNPSTGSAIGRQPASKLAVDLGLLDGPKRLRTGR